MGRLLGIDERPADCSGQTDRDQTGQLGRDMAPDYGKVPASGEGAGGEGRLQYSTTGRRSGGRDIGRH